MPAPIPRPPCHSARSRGIHAGWLIVRSREITSTPGRPAPEKLGKWVAISEAGELYSATRRGLMLQIRLANSTALGGTGQPGGRDEKIVC